MLLQPCTFCAYRRFVSSCSARTAVSKVGRSQRQLKQLQRIELLPPERDHAFKLPKGLLSL